jgi:L-lactate dehydrogenase
MSPNEANSSLMQSNTNMPSNGTKHPSMQELKSASSLRKYNESDSDPNLRFKEYFKSYQMENSVNPIPYDASIPQKPGDETPLGGFSHKKVSIIGCGQVGLAIAYAILNQELCGTLALVDIDSKKLEGEAKDFLQGSAFHQRISIEASSDYAVSKNSHLVIITAGAAQRPGESRLGLVERNTKIMGMVVPKVLENSPEAAICIVSNPCDVMTAVAAKIAGPSVPVGRIFGSGTCLDSSRLRSLIAQSLDLDPKNIHGYVIGEHGDSSIAVWSSVRVGALPLLKEDEEPDETLKCLHREVVHSAGDVIKLKGYTNWAIGKSSCFLCIMMAGCLVGWFSSLS